MAAVVILNIVFAVFVVVAMLSLLGRAIIADNGLTGVRIGLTARSTRSGKQAPSRGRHSPAPATQVAD